MFKNDMALSELLPEKFSQLILSWFWWIVQTDGWQLYENLSQSICLIWSKKIYNDRIRNTRKIDQLILSGFFSKKNNSVLITIIENFPNQFCLDFEVIN
jgi:hypothetical protein